MKLPKFTHPADGRRLLALSYRLNALVRCDVKIQREHREALKRVVDILMYEERQAARVDAPPSGFGKL